MGVVKVEATQNCNGTHLAAVTMIEHTDRKPVGICVVADPFITENNPECWSVETDDSEIMFAIGVTREDCLASLDNLMEELTAAREALVSIVMPKVEAPS